jgi:uncharacterized membrane protein YccC
MSFNTTPLVFTMIVAILASITTGFFDTFATKKVWKIAVISFAIAVCLHVMTLYRRMDCHEILCSTI